MYWQRVDVEDATATQSATGAEVLTWSSYIEDVEARLLPLVVDERLKDWATPEEAAYEVQLRGQQDVEPKMRLVSDSGYYDIRQVLQPPPFGEPCTILHVVKVTP